MSNILNAILRQKLSEIQSQLPSFVKLIRDTPASFENVLDSELLENNSAEGLYNNDYSRLIEAASRKYNISSNIIRAVIMAESGFDTRAVSKAGAIGLMQLMPDTAKALGVNDAFDPRENIDGGVRYLKNMLSEFGGNLELALAAYNAGPNSVKKYGGIPPYEEIQNYVKKVMSNLKARV